MELYKACFGLGKIKLIKNIKYVLMFIFLLLFYTTSFAQSKSKNSKVEYDNNLKKYNDEQSALYNSHLKNRVSRKEIIGKWKIVKSIVDGKNQPESIGQITQFTDSKTISNVKSPTIKSNNGKTSTTYSDETMESDYIITKDNKFVSKTNIFTTIVLVSDITELSATSFKIKGNMDLGGKKVSIETHYTRVK